MKKTKALALIIISVAVMLICCHAVFAQQTGFSLIYKDDGKGLIVTGFSGTVPENLVIPESVDGKPVYAIADYAFSECMDIKSVTMPSITYIGESAFMNCYSLSEVDMPNVITIFDSAFCECMSLTEIEIPASAIDIGLNPFGRSENLTSFIVDAQNPSYCGIDGMLLSKDTHTLYSYPSAKGEVVLPDYITEIGDFGMVELWNMKKLFAPCVRKIGVQGLAFCQNVNMTGEWYGLEKIDLPELIETEQAAIYQNAALTKVNLPKLRVLALDALSCNYLTAIDLPAIEVIDKNSLMACRGLTSFTIPETAKKVESSAFDNCENLAEFIVSENNPNYTSDGGILYSKDKSVLMCCPTAEGDIVIPDYVKEVGAYAFHNRPLTSVDMPSVVRIGEGAFASCGELITEIDNPSFAIWKPTLTTVNMPSVAEVCDYAFDQDDLQKIYLPEAVFIGDGAFSINPDLTDVYIPNVRDLGKWTFYSCGSIREIDIPYVKVIPVCCFSECLSIQKISMPSVERIDREAFAFCSSLESVSFYNIKSIGNWSFCYCNELTDVYFFCDAPEMGENVFYMCENEITLHVPHDAKGFDTDSFSEYNIEKFFNISGDVNQDGIVNTGDAVQILKYSAGMIKLDAVQEYVADMNKSGRVDTGDAVAVLKFCAGMITDFQ